MSIEFRDLLIDVVTVVEPFRDAISHINMKRAPSGDVVIGAKSSNGSVSVTATSKIDVPDLEGIACFGSIPYLSATLNSPLIKDNNSFSMETMYETASDKKTRALRHLTFKGGGNKLNVSFKVADPFISQLSKVKISAIRDWGASFKVDQDFIKSFNDVQKIHRAAPKMGGDRDDIFTLSYTGEEIIAIFGEKGHQTHMVLTDKATGDNKVNALLSITQLQSILKLLGKGEGEAKFAQKGLRIDFDTDYAVYTISILGKKESI